MKTRNIIYAVVLLMAGTMAGCRQTATIDPPPTQDPPQPSL